MLRSKSFVRKTRRGKVMKVVREHYLRNDIWYVRGSPLCHPPQPSPMPLPCGDTPPAVYVCTRAMRESAVLAGATGVCARS